MSIIFLFWLHVIKPMIQVSREVDSELQLIDQFVNDDIRLKNQFSMNLKMSDITPEDFIY